MPCLGLFHSTVNFQDIFVIIKERGAGICLARVGFFSRIRLSLGFPFFMVFQVLSYSGELNIKVIKDSVLP